MLIGRSRRSKVPGVLTAALVLVLVGCGKSGAQPPEDPFGSEEEYLSLVSDGWAETLGVEDPPEVEVVRYVGSDEVDTVYRECMSGSGSGYSGDGVGFIVPEGQESQFALAQYTCRMQHPVKQKYAQDWGKEQVQIQYQWTRDFLIPCLEEYGHPINSALPSEAKFVETWDSDSYFPFEEVSLSVTGEEYNLAWAELESQCPQVAPGEVLWDTMSIDTWQDLRR